MERADFVQLLTDGRTEMVALADYLGIGLYTPAEAALYARIAPRMMRRWVYGDRSGEAALRAERPDPERKSITFLDLIQAMAVRAIREEKQIPLQKIRQLLTTAEEQYGLKHPFARKHTTYRFGDDLWLEIGQDLIQATGRGRGQHGMKPIIEPYLEDLTYGEDGLARTYVAFSRDDVDIVMNPEYRFGEPIVGSTGISAWALWEACQAEGSFAAAAETYGVTTTEAKVAHQYIDFIRPATSD